MKETAVVKAKENYTTESLYAKIKDCQFSAGTPEYKELGILKKIKLPAAGRYCINIMAAGKRINLSIAEDMEQTGTYVANSMVRSQLGVFARALDNDKKPSVEMMEKTADELRRYLGV